MVFPFKVFLLVLLVIAANLTICSHTALADWPMGRANPQRTGATPEKLPEDLELSWQVDLGGLGFDAGPIIASGMVFAVDHDGRAYAFDLQTGDELWRKEFEDTGFLATPAYREGVLLVGDDVGVLRALEATTGQEKWSFETGTQLPISASPNFYKDSVIFTSEDGALYRLGFADGELIWKYETEAPILCGVTLAGDLTFLGGCDEQLHVIDVRTGEAIAEPIAIEPTESTPAVADSNVLVPTQPGVLFNFKMPDLEETWRFQDPKYASEFRSSMAVAHGMAVGAGQNKRVFAISIDSGEVAWSQTLRKRADASPAIADKSVIIAAADGRILRYDLESGKEQWMYETKGEFGSSPAIADGKLVLANLRGTIFCFGAAK